MQIIRWVGVLKMADSEQAYMCANVIAAAKEKAIKKAFDAYFERKDWVESDLDGMSLNMEISKIEGEGGVLHTGTETLIINGRKMVEFGRIECDIEIEGTCVQCLYRQSIKVLY